MLFRAAVYSAKEVKQVFNLTFEFKYQFLKLG